MEEAAQVSGAHWVRRLLLIAVPLVRNGLVAAWLVGYLFCLRDTGMTMLVYPAGHDTLPVRTFTLMANGTPELIAALCILTIASALVPSITRRALRRPSLFSPAVISETGYHVGFGRLSCRFPAHASDRVTLMPTAPSAKDHIRHHVSTISRQPTRVKAKAGRS